MAEMEGPLVRASRELNESMARHPAGKQRSPEPGTRDLAEPGMFASTDGLVINWLGENFYKSCNAVIRDFDIGGTSSCVKRVGHPNDHEDYDGFVKRADACELCQQSMDDHLVITTSLDIDGRKQSRPTGWLCPSKDKRHG